MVFSESGFALWRNALELSLVEDLRRAWGPENPLRTGCFRHMLQHEAFFRLFSHPSLLAFAGRALDCDLELNPAYSLRISMGGDQDREGRWHQDIGAVPRGKSLTEMINFWIPLDKVGEGNGCPQFIPGSHKSGPAPHGLFYSQLADSCIRPVLHSREEVAAAPGDAILFSSLVFHRVPPNQTDRPRRSVDFRLQPAGSPSMLSFPAIPWSTREGRPLMTLEAWKDFSFPAEERGA